MGTRTKEGRTTRGVIYNMNRWRVTMIDTANAEVYSEIVEYYGFPSHLSDPYCGMNGRTGSIVRVEKVMIPTPTNEYQ